MTKWLVVENRDARWYFDVSEIADNYALCKFSSDLEKTYEEHYLCLLNGPLLDIREWFHDNMKPEEIFNQKKIDKVKYWDTDYDYWHEIIDD